MKIIIQILLVLVMSFTGLAADKSRNLQEDDIREVVFRHQFKEQLERVNRYYLAIGEPDSDPSDDLMKRFTGNTSSFQKVSECRVVGLRVIDKKTGMRGRILKVSHVRWVSDLEVEVEGGYYEHGKSASGHTYTVTKKDGKWQITKDKLDWVS